MFNLARIMTTSDRQDEAIKVLNRIIKEQLKFGPAYRLLGNIFSQKGESKLGSYYIIRAKDLAEFSPPSDPLMDELVMQSRSELLLLKEIDIAVYNNNLQLALKLCNHSLKYFPEDKFLIYKCVRVFLATGKDKQTLALLDRHFRNFEQDYDEMMDIAERLYAKGYAPEAVRFFEQAKKLKPQNPYLPIWLSKYNMIEAASQLLKTQLEKDPNNPEMISNAVIISMDKGDKEEAKSWLTKLKAIAPNYPEIKRYEGYFAEMEGNNNEVISKWEEVIRAEPKDLRMINDLGVFYSKNKMFAKAKYLYQQALESNPNVPFLLDELSKLLVFCPDEKLRNIIEGKEYAERAFFGFTSDAKIRLSASTTLATAYAMSGDKQNAIIFINITLSQAKKENVEQDYFAYFDGLKKQYGL
jgi:tetratricopeptide (TPR) repeat protein